MTDNLSLKVKEICPYDKYQKSTANSYLNWRNDGKNAVDDAEHFEHCIVQWLLNKIRHCKVEISIGWTNQTQSGRMHCYNFEWI